MNDTDMGQIVTPMSRGGKKRELMHKYGVSSRRRGGRMHYAEGGDTEASAAPKKSTWWELLQQAIKELTPSSPLGSAANDSAAPLRPYAPRVIRDRQQDIDSAVDAADHKRGGRAKKKRKG